MSRQRNSEIAKSLWGEIPQHAMDSLKELTTRHSLSISLGEVLFLDGRWYVTHAGLLRIASRKCCSGIHVRPAVGFCDPAASRWTFKAIVYKSPGCRGFVGYRRQVHPERGAHQLGQGGLVSLSGRPQAGPDRHGPVLVDLHGAELRIAETRAVNRALRKAYAIGICSVEELASSAAGSPRSAQESKKLPPQPANGNYGGPKVRDRLCQIIRQHQLDPALVKAYATDFCGTKTLREASRDQVENFVTHLSDWAEKDRGALLWQLNSYLGNKEGAA